ncbi:MAG: PP2C family serine/threonine-protein phosphatase [Pseudomonadota bacterium]
MRATTAAASLIGNRDENQDRYSVVNHEDISFVAVVDGMGGHDAGARAAEVAVETFRNRLASATRAAHDPRDAIKGLIRAAHSAVVAIGKNGPPESSPRATCAVAIIQNGKACFGHVGDSRAYLLRSGEVVTRTRDHSHIEILLREQLITEEEYRTHPLRHYVEHSLGGDPGDASVTVSPLHTLEPGDQILVCSDGVWNAFEDTEIASFLNRPEARLSPDPALRDLIKKSVAKCAPSADNTTAALIQWQGLDGTDRS